MNCWISSNVDGSRVVMQSIVFSHWFRRLTAFSFRFVVQLNAFGWDRAWWPNVLKLKPDSSSYRRARRILQEPCRQLSSKSLILLVDCQLPLPWKWLSSRRDSTIKWLGWLAGIRRCRQNHWGILWILLVVVHYRSRIQCLWSTNSSILSRCCSFEE
jgi:hypothetical protein